MTSALYKCFRLVCDTHASWDIFKIKVQHKHGGNCDKGGPTRQKPLLCYFLMICVCFAYHCHTFIWLFFRCFVHFFLFFLAPSNYEELFVSLQLFCLSLRSVSFHSCFLSVYFLCVGLVFFFLCISSRFLLSKGGFTVLDLYPFA